MSAVQIHLEYTEIAAVEYYAETLGVSPEDIAYAALHELMLRAKDPEVQHRIVRTRSARRATPAPWGDSKHATHHPFQDEMAAGSLSRFF
ncbi:MAG: hypothetical protein HZA93_16620 [Verrucomicrobia bacterium]|nr:hypothetical protein [Verrucomicrobiota bacterium]